MTKFSRAMADWRNYKSKLDQHQVDMLKLGTVMRDDNNALVKIISTIVELQYMTNSLHR